MPKRKRDRFFYPCTHESVPNKAHRERMENGDHWYLVLDPAHDSIAREALNVYAQLIRPYDKDLSDLLLRRVQYYYGRPHVDGR